MRYLDDIIIFSRKFSEHNQRLHIVLIQIAQDGLILHSKKCHFDDSQTLVLGFLGDREGIRTDPHKTSAVRYFAKPRTVKDLRRFLGLGSYFRRLIKNFAQVAHPLHLLLRADAVVSWTSEHEASLVQLKFL